MDNVLFLSTPVTFGTTWSSLYGQVSISTTGNHVLKIAGLTSGAMVGFTNAFLYLATGDGGGGRGRGI